MALLVLGKQVRRHRLLGRQAFRHLALQLAQRAAGEGRMGEKGGGTNR